MRTPNLRAAFVVLGTLLATVLGAQTRMVVDAPGTWKPWKFTAVASARQELSASAAEVKAFEAQLLALNAILQRAPGVATPRGFSVETWGYLSGYRAAGKGGPAGSAVPLAGGLDFGAFPIFEYQRDGKTIREDTGETALMLFQVNQLDAALIAGGRVPDWVGRSDEAFLQPPSKGEIAGFPRFGDILVIKKNPGSPWAPVSMEAAIGLVVASRETELEDQRATVKRVEASLADWQNPEKRAERFKGYEVAAATQPDKAAFLAQMAQVEKDAAASLQEDLTPEGDVMKGYLEVERALADAAAWLKDLSAADRAAPACYLASGGTLRQRLRSGTAAGCVPVVRPNWAFFDPALARSAPQLVVIPGVARCFDDQPASPATPAGCPANRQLLLTWDRQAVLDWLK